MIVAEVRAGHMPMEILGLQIEREHVGEQDIERAGNLRNRVGAQVGRRIERCNPPRGGVSCFAHGYLLIEAMTGAGRGAVIQNIMPGRPPCNPYMGVVASNGLIVLAVY